MIVIGCPKKTKILDASFPTLKHENHDLDTNRSARLCVEDILKSTLSLVDSPPSSNSGLRQFLSHHFPCLPELHQQEQPEVRVIPHLTMQYLQCSQNKMPWI